MPPSRPARILRRVRAIPRRPWGPAEQLDVHGILMDLFWAYLELQKENRRVVREIAARGG